MRVKPPPVEDLAAERALLGAALLDEAAVPTALSVPAVAFHSEKHRAIRAAIEAVAQRGQAVDHITLQAELTARGEPDAADPVVIANLLEEAAVATNAGAYAQMIGEAARKRRLARLSHELETNAANGQPSREVVEWLQRELAQLDELGGSAFAATPPLRVVPWPELVSGPAETVEYHWPGWIARESVAVLAGAGESYKSWVALFLACLTGAGLPAFAEPGSDESPVRQGPVLYLAGENALAEERRRCQLLQAGLQLPDDLPIAFVDAGGLSLSNPTEYAALVALVREFRPVLIVLDSAIALSGLARENDNSEVRAFLKGRVLPLARQHGATVLLIAHSPKIPLQPGVAFGDEHVARGAGDWRNAADTVLYLKREVGLGEFAVVLRHAKQRIGPRHTPVWFEFEDVEPGRAVRPKFGGLFRDDWEGVQAGVRKAAADIVAVLKELPDGIHLKGLAERVAGRGTTKASCRRALDLLRGRKPWPWGPHRGKAHAVLADERRGREVFVTLDLSRLPEDWDDA